MSIFRSEEGSTKNYVGSANREQKLKVVLLYRSEEYWYSTEE